MKGGGGFFSKFKTKIDSPSIKQNQTLKKSVVFSENPVSDIYSLSPQEKQEFYKKNLSNRIPRTKTNRKTRKEKSEIRQKAIREYNQRESQRKRKEQIDKWLFGKSLSKKGGKIKKTKKNQKNNTKKQRNYTN